MEFLDLSITEFQVFREVSSRFDNNYMKCVLADSSDYEQSKSLLPEAVQLKSETIVINLAPDHDFDFKGDPYARLSRKILIREELIDCVVNHIITAVDMTRQDRHNPTYFSSFELLLDVSQLSRFIIHYPEKPLNNQISAFYTIIPYQSIISYP